MRNLIFIFILFIISSCRKGGGAYLEGRLIETGYETPVTNCRIQLHEIKNGNQGQYIEDAVTDSEGKFKIYYRRRFAYQYEYHVDSDKFLKIEGGGKADKRKIHVVLRAMRKSYVKFTIRNSLSDSVDLFLSSQYSSGKYRLPANSDKAFSPMVMAGYGSNEFTWHYVTCTSKQTSPTKTETIDVVNHEDTIYRKFNLN